MNARLRSSVHGVSKDYTFQLTLTETQIARLKEINASVIFPASYRDRWCDALHRRGLIDQDNRGDYIITAAGEYVLKLVGEAGL